MPTMNELFTSKGCVIFYNSQRLQSQLTSLHQHYQNGKLPEKKQNQQVSNRCQSSQEYHKHLKYFRKADCAVPQLQQLRYVLNMQAKVKTACVQYFSHAKWAFSSEQSILTAFCKYSRLPITRTFKGNRKTFRVIGSSKKIAESKVKKSFYCTVNILITFHCRNVK